MRTTVLDATDALLAQISQLAPDSVVVQLGLPAQLPQKRERMYLLEPDEHQRDRDYEKTLVREGYLLPVIIEVHLVGDDPRLSKARMWELYDLLEDAVLADEELGGAVGAAAMGTSEDAGSGPGEHGWVARRLVYVVAAAQI